MVPPVEETTKDGYDLQFGTNVLGHYLFTMELLPALLSGAKSSPDKKARVVNTSSFAQESETGIKWDTLSDGPARKKVGKWGLYSQSKFVRRFHFLSVLHAVTIYLY
jgi:NAD(P)-dependent dehydrogenase (short-subunit alcohol dehydrogenase family)